MKIKVLQHVSPFPPSQIIEQGSTATRTLQTLHCPNGKRKQRKVKVIRNLFALRRDWDQTDSRLWGTVETWAIRFVPGTISFGYESNGEMKKVTKKIILIKHMKSELFSYLSAAAVVPVYQDLWHRLSPCLCWLRSWFDLSQIIADIKILFSPISSVCRYFFQFLYSEYAWEAKPGAVKALETFVIYTCVQVPVLS